MTLPGIMCWQFGSIVDAVQCAIEIQKELKAKNTELPENQKMEFRMGVNIGDVIEEGKKIYGEGSILLHGSRAWLKEEAFVSQGLLTIR